MGPVTSCHHVSSTHLLRTPQLDSTRNSSAPSSSSPSLSKSTVPRPRPRSSPTVGSIVAANFDNPVLLAYASEVNHQRWFVVWRCEVGFESLQAPNECPSVHSCPTSALAWFLRAAWARHMASAIDSGRWLALSAVAGGRFSSGGKPRRRRRFSIIASTILRSCRSLSAQRASCTSSLETRRFIAFMAYYAGRPSFAATKRTVKISRPYAISSFRGLWHSFTSRTFKAQNKPVVAYQHHRFVKLRDSSRQMNNVTAPTAFP